VGASLGGGSARGGRRGRGGRIATGTLAEINVTPLVDVMLVLLVIFMTASSVETARLSREAETLRQVVAEDQTERVPDDAKKERHVEVDLPKAEAQRIPADKRTEAVVLSIDARWRIHIGETTLAECHPKANKHPSQEACLDAFEAALAGHEAARAQRSVQVRADRGLPYGFVLATLARLRRAGISSFGLVTEVPAGGDAG
jgi:biopolymer transport protein TolR